MRRRAEHQQDMFPVPQQSPFLAFRGRRKTMRSRIGYVHDAFVREAWRRYDRRLQAR